MPAAAWNHLVVAASPSDQGLRCELRDGRVIAFGPEWRGQISVTDRLYIAEQVTVVDRETALHLERSGRLDLAQIPTIAAAPPRVDRHSRGFVMLDAANAQHGIAKALVTAAQIRDYFFAPDRTAEWSKQPSWFEVLGVRRNSTPAEIRLAYRVRMLELRAEQGRSNRSTQAQLARGLQILLDPDLRRSYLSLVENPEANIAFPPWTVGCLRATGQKRGDLFVVDEFLSFIPHTEERGLRLALRRFRFEGPEVIYRDARKRILIRFDSSLLPMQWTEEWNTWAHLALGSTTIEGVFWQQTRFRRTDAGFQPVTWSQPFQSTVKLENASAVEPRFRAARAFWGHFHPHAEIVALLRAKIEDKPMKAEEATEWCATRGVRTPIEARWINWEPDYEEAYYRELSRRAKTVYLFRNEYLFLFHQTIVSEIPQSGHATYIFHPSVSLETWLQRYARTTRHKIRTDPVIARHTLGYAGRIAHLKELPAWFAKIERTFASPERMSGDGERQLATL